VARPGILDCTAFAIRRADAPKSRRRLSAVTVDTTEYEQIRARLWPPQQTEPMADSSAGATHDLINYLAVIDGCISLLLMDANPGGRMHMVLTEADHAAKRCISLTRHLLDVSRTEAHRPRELCVNDVLAGVEAVLRRLVGKGIELIISCAPDVGLVQADPQEIERILLNLVVNARQAIAGTGTITLLTSNTQDDHVGGREVGPAPYVVISVSDDGTGMDAETCAHLFEPFFTTTEEGTGLGLAIVYDIVARRGGHVQVESEPGHGTTFRVLLPRIDDDRMAGRCSHE
jgi:signal transduction histidine kinase